MIHKNYHVEMNITLHGVSMPYHVMADFEVEIEFDADLEPLIKTICLIEAIIVDRYDDNLQFKIIPDKNNFIFCEIEKQIMQAIEEKESENIINQWLIDCENSYLETAGKIK